MAGKENTTASRYAVVIQVEDRCGGYVERYKRRTAAYAYGEMMLSVQEIT